MKTARDFVRTTLVSWGVRPEGCVLLTSELVTNAVRHSRVEVVVTVWRSDARVRIEVRDESPESPTLGTPGEDATRGRGLTLVDRVADAWGYVRHDGQGKTVWLEVAT